MRVETRTKVIERTAEHGIREPQMAIKQPIGVHMDISMYIVCNGVTMDDEKIKMIGEGSLIQAVITCNKGGAGKRRDETTHLP